MSCFRFLLVLVICLSLAVVPVTGLGEENQVDVSGLQPFLDIIVDAADAREISTMSMGQEESASLSYGIMYRLIYRGVIPATVTDDGVALLYQDELQKLYEQLFAAGTFLLPEDDCCDMITRVDQGLSFDVSTASGGIIGAQIMLAEAQEQTGRLRIVAELYRSPEDYYVFSKEHLAQATWFGMAEFQLQQDDQSMFGYTLVSYARYLDGENEEQNLLDYTDEEHGFSIQYPNSFDGRLQKTEHGVNATLLDGSASFSVEKQPGGVSLSQLSQQMVTAHPEGALAMFEDRSYFSFYWQDGTTCHYLVTYVGEKYQYTAELVYGQAAEALYAPYGEYMENSFTVYELSVG